MNPLAMWRHRALILRLVGREVAGRYRGSMLGVGWALVHPLLLLGAYAFAFGAVLRVRWPGAAGGADFALNLFAGMIVHGMFAECANRAPGLVLENVSYVKKVVFPLEILPLAATLSALFHAMVSLGALLAFWMWAHGLPRPTALWLPVVWLPLAMLSLGASWFLASLGAYLRDVGQLVGVATTALLFLSPVFYPASSLPPWARDWMHANPLAAIITQTRAVLLRGEAPDWGAWGVSMAIGMAAAWLGHAWFCKTRRGFADVL